MLLERSPFHFPARRSFKRGPGRCAGAGNDAGDDAGAEFVAFRSPEPCSRVVPAELRHPSGRARAQSCAAGALRSQEATSLPLPLPPLAFLEHLPLRGLLVVPSPEHAALREPRRSGGRSRGWGFGLTEVTEGPPDTCAGLNEPVQGSVESTVGTFAHGNGEARFWMSDTGCITEVDLELKSGGCSVTFRAEGLLDAEDRFLITNVSLSMPGLCPGYPAGLGSGTYYQSATDQPFGTIEVQRERASWSECRPGTLVATPNVVLKGFGTAGKPDIGFSTPIQVSGSFSWTHYDPSGECPTVFF